MTFQIVREISSGQKHVNGRMVDTMQATVRFSDGDTTRHLIRQPVGWTGWNSDRARRERAGILESHTAHQERVQAVTASIAKFTDALGELKNKRGAEATAERKLLRAALKTAKAVASVAGADLARVAEVSGRVDETHPEKVEFA